MIKNTAWKQSSNKYKMKYKKFLALIKTGRKGISPVVATLLIVFVTVAAVTLVAKFIVPLVTNNLNEGTECVDYSDYFYFEEDFLGQLLLWFTLGFIYLMVISFSKKQ